MAKSVRPTEAFPITTRELRVLRVEDVTPGMRRIVLGGDGLAAHTADTGYSVGAFRSDGFDDHVKVILRHPDLTEPLLPKQMDGVLEWPRDDRSVVRTYTVRRWDPEHGEVDVDVVTHGDGPGVRWAVTARPGDAVHIAGPRRSSGHPRDVDWVLVAGDETALPAIARWLEEWPDGQRGRVLIEVSSEDRRQDLPHPPGVDVTWIDSAGTDPGATTLLADAVRNLEWWDGTGFVWVAGEAGAVAPLRRWLRDERDLRDEQVQITAYWHRGDG